jgi:hypothetical protein
MKYKIHVSAFLEDSNQLLVSFSSDDTQHDAKDYRSLAFDIITYGDVTADEIIEQIAKCAPSVCADQVVAETYESNDERASALRALVGQSFEYTQEELEGRTVV